MSRIFIPNNLSRAQLDAFRSIEAELNRLSNEKTVLTGSGAPTEVNNLQDGSIFYDFTNLNLYVFKLAASSWNDPTLASTNASNAIAANIYVSGTETINGAVIADGTVTVNELAANSITSQKLVVTGSNAITPATISADPAGSASAAQSNAATDATNKVAVVTNNIFTANTTTIDGAKITTGTVIANKLVLNQNILEVEGNQLSLVGAALNRRHYFNTTPPSAGSSFGTPGTAKTTVIPIAFGATAVILTGCGAGGGRVAQVRAVGSTNGIGGGGGAATCQDFGIDLNSSHTHIQVVIGAGSIGGAGGSAVVTTGTLSGSNFSAGTVIITLGGGSVGLAKTRLAGSSTTANAFGGNGGTPSPSVQGKSHIGAIGHHTIITGTGAVGSSTQGYDVENLLPMANGVNVNLNDGFGGEAGCNRLNSTQMDWVFGKGGERNGDNAQGFGGGVGGARGFQSTGSTATTAPKAGADGFLILDFGA